MEENIEKAIIRFSSDVGTCTSQAETIEKLSKSLMWLRISKLVNLANTLALTGIKMMADKQEAGRG